MNSFFHWLCNPLLVFVILLFVSLIFKALRKDKQAFWLFGGGIFWILLVSCTPLPQFLAYSLEKQYLPFNYNELKNDFPSYILVLGGGHTVSPSLPAGQQLSGTAIVRLAEGIRIHNLHAQCKLICSGYSSSNRTTQAEILANAAHELGVSRKDTIQLRLPGNTEEEIHAFKTRFGSAKVIIVTSALHMPRAMMIAQTYQVNAWPAPADFLIKHDDHVQRFDFYPSAQKMVIMERVLHEYGGIIKYKIFN